MTNKIPLQAVLWDVDGTLIDTTALIVSALSATFLEFTGQSMPVEDLRALIGIPVEKQVYAFGDPVSFGTTEEQMVAAAIKRYERGRSQEHIVQEAVDALITAKRRGMKTALVTSKNDLELANSLPRLGISAYCDAIVGADQVAPNYKPHPRPVLLALELLGIDDPAEAVLVGDSVHDMRSARAAGARTAAVLWGAASEASLRAEDPDFVIATPEELVPTLLGSLVPA